MDNGLGSQGNQEGFVYYLAFYLTDDLHEILMNCYISMALPEFKINK